MAKPVTGESADADPEVLASTEAPLIVLEESRLDEPVEDAIRKLRENPRNRTARILVVGPEDGKAAGESVLHPQQLRRAARPDESREIDVRIDDAIQRTGERWLQGEELVARWLEEQRHLVRDLEDSLAASNLTGVARDLRRLWELGRWIGGTVDDNLYHARKASRGMELVGSVELVRDAARRFHLTEEGVDLLLPPLRESLFLA